MRSKRLLAMLLAVCMVLSVFSPAALAVEAGSDMFVNAAENAENNESNNASSKENDLLISPEDINRHENLNLRDDPLYKMEIENEAEGHWEITPAGKPQISLTPDAPACLEELKKAEEFYSAEEIVKAFVVMEDAPLAESTNSITLASASAQKLLIEKQDSVISAIEKTVMNGQKLDVRYQFTYLTNAFTIETNFANLAKIAFLPGVKDVVIMSTWEAVPTETVDPLTAASGAMTGVDTVWADLGFTGEGMKIAIVDTGLDLDHPSFAAAPAGADMDVADIAAVLENLNIYKRLGSSLKAEDLYRSEKVPFAFNYCDTNLNADHSRDRQGDHGTHVAGIAAANKTEGTSVVGMAPDAQIIVMKVFGQGGGAYTDDFVAAIEDAMTLGCDVVNLSLGSPGGFSYSGYETVDDVIVDEVFARLATQDIIATISAGNETNSSYGNMWGTDLNRTQNPENGVVGSPSTYMNSFSIASAENCVVMTDYLAMADGTEIFFQPSIEYLYGYVWGIKEIYAGETLEYAIVPGLGAAEDFYDEEENSIVDGKIAVIKRGELSFAEKIANAEDAGAVAAIIWNSNDTDDIFTFGMTTEISEGVYPGIPALLITLSDGQKLADAETKTLLIAEDLGERHVQGGQMSSFSSWGTTSDLRLVPDITGIGGNVFSTLDGGAYGVMSGTSMSAPQVAGISALVMQALKEKFPNAEEGKIREMALALMMSTANPVIANDSGVEASPRQQGAGLVNAAEAILSGAYLSVNGGRPKVELKDSSTGNFKFEFKIHNISDEDATYVLDASLLTEYVTGFMISETEAEYFMAGFDVELSGSVTFDKDEVTVPAGKTAKVTVSISLSEDDKAYFDACWENGGYVEGYIYLDNTADDGIDLNLPFLGFYGDWTEAPVFDTADWYDNTFWGLNPATGLPEGDQYYNVIWTSLAGTDWVLGMNPYSGALEDENGNIMYDPANNALSPNGDGVLDNIDEIYLSLLRNAEVLTFTYTNAETGELLFQEEAINNRKTMFISAYAQVVPWIGSWSLDTFYYGQPYNFTDAEGNPLPSDTQVLLTIEAKIDYGTGGDNVMEIPIYVDTTYPELVNVYEAPLFGDNLLILDVADNHNIASVVILNASGTQILGQDFDVNAEILSNGNERYYFDVTGMGTELTVVVCDYAGNEAAYTIEYTADPDGNLPVMDTTKLYGYRVNDSIIGQYYGYDQMFGWISMDKPGEGDAYTWVDQENSDALEYWALTAAEYAGGKIFAVDAGYNFLVMDPGLWNRQTVTNLGVSALDMAFDDTTDTMYLLAKQGNYTYLYSIDLLTGALTQLKSFGYFTYAPYALTVADDGTIYAIKYSQSSYYDCYLYTLDQENGYAMVAVTDANGEKIKFTDAEGTSLIPNYAQSMTYADGVIYWTYFSSTYYGNAAKLIVIDPSNDHAWAMYDLATFYPDLGGGTFSDTEIIGLLTLDETDYEIPASDSLDTIQVANDRVVLELGDATAVKAYPLPWNYELDGLIWTSSNEDVAYVDETGAIYGLAEGDAVVTVSYGDLSAEIQVTVVDPDSNFFAYNYYSAAGFGDFINVDFGSGSLTSLGNSPVDFIAGDYNGHDGWFYGYTEGGQMYKLNIETGDIVMIGAPTGVNPADMAYDYSTGYMYASYVNDMGLAVLAYADMKTGKLVDVAMDYEYAMSLLACDLEGNLYTLTADGYLAKIVPVEGVDWMTGEPMIYLEYEILMEELGYLQYQQSMCYDHANNVILWTNPETSVVYWLDFNNANPYALSLGDPSGSGLIEWLGMFTIPAEIPELAPVAVETVTADDMFMMVGAEKLPSINILPLNANDYTYTLVSSDDAVVAIEEGMLVAKSEGVATITLTVDDAVSGVPTVVTFTVTTADAADNVFGHVMTDIATYGGMYWVEIPTTDPENPIPLMDTYYVMYAEEYYDGKLYAFGYDGNDWEANFQFMIMDPETYEVLEMHDMGEGFPFVYDMTYDYNTSTMYCVAGAGSEASNLYAVNMNTGKLTLIMETEQFFMSLAAGPEGLYAVEHSVTNGDPMDPWATPETLNAQLYLIDPSTMEIEVVGDTGLIFNSIGSMAYDYDTDYLYWTPLDQNTMAGGLAIVDPETGVANIIDAIGMMGAQVSGLYIICDEYPEENPQLHELFVTPAKSLVFVGSTGIIDVSTLSMNLDAEITFKSSDETVATVDENGVVTGIAQGTATITVTASFEGVVKEGTCEVTVMNADASFLTYNVTDGGWAIINRADPTMVTNLTEGAEESAPTALAAIGTTIYGYDEEGNLFSLNAETFERTVLGTANEAAVIEEYMTSMEVTEYNPEEYTLIVRDLAYDSANDRMLALGTVFGLGDYGGEMYCGSSIYSVDLTTGELTNLYQIYTHDTIMGMTVDNAGIIYYYNAFDDHYTALDLEAGTEFDIVSLQSLSVYGSYEDHHELFYDELTGMIYHLFTSNGSFYKLFALDTVTGSVTEQGNVGEVYYDYDLWVNVGDYFTGMVFVDGVSFEPVVKENPFIDVTEDDYFFDSVLWAYENGITAGKGSPDTFCPDLECSRAEVVTFLWRAYGAPEMDGVENPFTDVSEDAYYYDAVLWAYENGITAGKGGANTFCPTLKCTRAEVVTFLWRAAGSPEPETTESIFSDVEDGKWYTDAILWAAENEITTGKSDGTFGTNLICTRAQVVTFLYRCMAE